MYCIFCSILNGQLPSAKIAETSSLIVIKDINPKASIHYLIIPKSHVADIQALEHDQLDAARDIFVMAQQLSKTVAGADDFKLHINSGKNAGQLVMHLHAHFLAGKLTGTP